MSIVESDWSDPNPRHRPDVTRRSLLFSFASSWILASVCLFGSANAGQLTYQPINPSFGGSPFNGDWLLNQANTIRPQPDGDAGGGGSSGFPDFGDLFGDIDTVIGIDNPDDGDGGDVGDGGDGGDGGTG